MHATPRSGPHQATPVRPIPPWPTGPNQLGDSPAERLRKWMHTDARTGPGAGSYCLIEPFVLATARLCYPCPWPLTDPNGASRRRLQITLQQLCCRNLALPAY